MGESTQLDLAAESRLPDWADWLLKLGAVVYERGAHRTRKVQVCLSLPTRVSAAALIGAGAAIGSLAAARPESPEAHFERLAALPSRTPITVMCTDGRLRSGWLEGPAKIQGDSYIRWTERRASSPLARGLRLDRCLAIQPMGPGAEPFAVPKEPFRDLLSAEILDGLALGIAAIAATTSHCASVIITTLVQIQPELDDRVVISARGAVPLVDLVRPQQFQPTGIPYRTVVVPSSADCLPEAAGESPPVAVFDGAQAYLRLRDSVNAGASVLLVDRWSASAVPAVAAFLQDQPAEGGQQLIGLLRDCPPGVELMASGGQP